MAGSMMQTKRIQVIARPNGAGKTVVVTQFLPNETERPTMVNADQIAAGLSPFRPDVAAVRADRLMLNLLRDQVGMGESSPRRNSIPSP